jgi:hypothetical protein
MRDNVLRRGPAYLHIALISQMPCTGTTPRVHQYAVPKAYTPSRTDSRQYQSDATLSGYILPEMKLHYGMKIHQILGAQNRNRFGSEVSAARKQRIERSQRACLSLTLSGPMNWSQRASADAWLVLKPR